MQLSKLLEQRQEGEWIALETEEGAKLEGKLETNREYTDEQRKEIYQNAQYFGRKDQKQFSVNRALEPPQDSHIPNLEPHGKAVTATITNEFDNYTVKITQFNNSTHVTLETDKGHQRDFNIEEASLEIYEEAMNQYSQQMDLGIMEKDTTTEERRKVLN